MSLSVAASASAANSPLTAQQVQSAADAAASSLPAWSLTSSAPLDQVTSSAAQNLANIVVYDQTARLSGNTAVTAAASGSSDATTITYGVGGVPADSVAIPELAGGGPTSSAITPTVDDHTVTVQGSGVPGDLDGQAGVYSEHYQSDYVFDNQGSASVSLASNLSGVTAQSVAGNFTLQLAQDLQSNTVADATTGGLDFTQGGAAQFVQSVTKLLLARNFTADQAASSAAELAQAITGSAQTVTLDLQGRTDTSQSFLHAPSPGDGSQVTASGYDYDEQSADDIGISLDTGTGALSVNLDERYQGSSSSATTAQTDDLGAALDSAPLQGLGVVVDGTVGVQSTQSTAGSPLQESDTTTRFGSAQSSVTLTTTAGSSLSITDDHTEGALRTQDIGAAQTLQQESRTEFNTIAPTVSILFNGAAKAAAADGSATPATPAAPTHLTIKSLGAGASALHPQTAFAVTELTHILDLLQPATPQAQSGAGQSPSATAALPADAKLQSLTTSQASLTTTVTTKGYANNSDTLNQNNRFLSALYISPSQAKGGTQVTA
jgi:hypothetical protein